MQGSTFDDPDETQLSIDTDLTLMRRNLQRYGWDALEMNPLLVSHWFAGVTTDTIRCIDTLYCDRLCRSIWSVNEILAAMARHAGVDPVEPIAVWAICTYFTRRREKQTSLTISRQSSVWLFDVVEPPITVVEQSEREFSPQILTIADSTTGKVLAFRISHIDELEAAAKHCLYDAIVSQRKPCASDAAGLEWPIPYKIRVTPSLSVAAVRDVVAEIPGIMVESARIEYSDVPATEQILHAGWFESLRSQTTDIARLNVLFDQYLFRKLASGPRRSLEERGRELDQLTGYSRDPADVFPALRKMLIRGHGCISPEGTVDFNGLAYAHDFLPMWPGRNVELRRSATSEAFAPMCL